MALLQRLPRHLFTPRGWGMLAAGAAALAAAQVMGRRDLLTLALLLLVLPLVCLAGLRLVTTRLQVFREFNPSPVETSATATVRLAVGRSGTAGGHITMEEKLPDRFGRPPAFQFPSRASGGGSSRYEYRLRSAQRGQFLIGPVTAEFVDPFGLALHRRPIDDGDLLTVTPAAVVLPPTGLVGARGNDGSTPSKSRANPSNDDVMTREYRHGDPMRRVHWAATARHGALMVRQEETAATPEATIILDHRSAAFAPAAGAHAGSAARNGSPGGSSESFEWAVVAAMSLAAHLIERNYALHLLDAGGEPAFLSSPSAPEPLAAEYSGSSGLQSVAESLAAIQLTGSGGHRNVHKGHGHKDSGIMPFDNHLMDRLAASRGRGPLIAVLGRISRPEALSLAPAAAYGTSAIAMIVCEHPAEVEGELEALRQGGWRAVAVPPTVSVAVAWNGLGQDGNVSDGDPVKAGTGVAP